MSRYTDVNDDVVEKFLHVLETRFPSLIQLKTKLIFNNKRKVEKGDMVLATVESANDRMRYLSKDDVAIEGYDLLIILDSKAWGLANDKDKERIISHELRHVFIDEGGKVKLLPHDISDFRAEVAINKDDPDWKFKLATLTNDVYEQEKEMTKQSATLKKKKENTNG